MDNDSILEDINSDEKEVSTMQGFFTRLIDFAIDILIMLLVYKLLPIEISNLIRGNTLMLLLVLIVLFSGFKLIFLLSFGKTIGMMVCGVKLLNKDLKPLSGKEKILSLFRSRFSKIKYYKDR